MIRRDAVPRTDAVERSSTERLGPGSELARVRRLLLGEEYERVLELRRRLEDPELYTRSIADVLPSAVLERSRRDDALTRALMPNVESALKVSVERDPKPLVDALFPVIGPAIRRSITEALHQTLDALNELVEQRLSLRSLKWRMDAWRTGKSFAEIALCHTFAYHVEQVFLIHRETGLLLQHLQSSRAVVHDPDMVSGMLSAIQDFLTDSFDVERGEVLHSMRLGDLTVVVEQGPLAVIAAAVRGNPNAELATTMLEALEEIHLLFNRELHEFSGDNTPLAAVQPVLGRCLKSQRAEGSSTSMSRKRVIAVLIMLALIAPAVYWVHSAYQERRAWNAVLDRLNAEPGLVVLSARRESGVRSIRLLRDPLAADPRELVADLVPAGSEIVWTASPYVGLDAGLVLERAERALNAPAGVSITLVGETLRMSGEAEPAWVDSLEWRSSSIPGVTAIDTTGLVVVDLREAQYAEHKQAVERTVLSFTRGDAELEPNDAAALRELALAVRRLQTTALELQRSVWIRVVGHTDSAGDDERNLELSRARAQSVVDALVDLGLPRGVFLVEGLGARTPRVEDSTAPINRRVELHVVNVSDRPLEGVQR